MIVSKGSLEKVVIIVVFNNLLMLYDNSSLESDKKDLKLVLNSSGFVLSLQVRNTVG